MAKSPKTPPAAPEPEIRSLTPPLMDASAARALAAAQEKLGYDAPPIVAASIEAEAQAPSAPTQTADTPAAGDAGAAQ
ncbi:hypothetical protein [Caulobacter segnis]|nr:hypothetical protein [Caulobacter segnis]